MSEGVFQNVKTKHRARHHISMHHLALTMHIRIASCPFPLRLMSDRNNGSLLSFKDSSNTKLPVAAGAALTFIGATLALTAPFVVLKTPLPYMATPAHKIARALPITPRKRQTRNLCRFGQWRRYNTLHQAHVCRISSSHWL